MKTIHTQWESAPVEKNTQTSQVITIRKKDLAELQETLTRLKSMVMIRESDTVAWRLAVSSLLSQLVHVLSNTDDR